MSCRHCVGGRREFLAEGTQEVSGQETCLECWRNSDRGHRGLKKVSDDRVGIAQLWRAGEMIENH